MKLLLRVRAPSAIGLVFALLLTVVLPSHRGGAQGTPTETLMFAPVGDTYVQSSSPGTNYDDADLFKADDNPVRISYLRFVVTGVNGRPVQSARLQLEVTGPSVSGGSIHTVSDGSWQADTVTFANRPAVDVPVVDTLGAVTSGSIVEFNLDSVVTGDGAYGVAIDSASSDGVSYASMATSDAQPPRLILEVQSGPHPLVTIVQPPDASTFFVGDSVSLQATVTDDLDVNLETLVQWTSDRDGGLGVGASVSPTLSEGTHVVTATVTDSDELTGSDQVGITIVPPPPGNTAPLVSITAPLDNQTFTSTEPIAFTGTATDLEDGLLTSALSWTSDQDGLIGLGGNFTTTLSEGSHEITASVTDAGGLDGTAAVSVNVIAPDIVTLEPLADTYVDSVRPTTNYGSDGLLRVDADSERTTYLRFDVAGIGNRTVSRATLRLEVAGDSGAGSDGGGTVHTISNDTWVENVMTYNTRPVVDGPAFAMAGAVGPGDVVDFDVTAAVTEDGVYNFAVVGDSPDGVKYLSREAKPPTLILELSGNAPMVTISAPTDGDVIFTGDLPLQLAAAATDTEDGDVTATISWTSDLDGALGTGGNVAAGGLSIGTHTITAAATDGDGLMGHAHVSVTVRAPNAAPVVNVTAPVDGASIPAGTMVGLAGTATDDFDGNLSGALSWSSNVSGALGTGSPLAVTLTEGAHTLTASATDSDGAVGSDQVAVTITPTAPMVSIVQPAAGAMVFSGNVVTFTGTASDATDGDVSGGLVWTSSIDGQVGTGPTFTTTALSQGMHTVTAAVTDGGGLTGQAAVTVEVRPPNTLPLVMIDAPADGATLLGDAPLVLSGSASDAEDGDLGAQITWTSNLDGALGTGAIVSVASLSQGTHALAASVTDADGGVATDTVTVTIGDPTIVVVAEADTYVDNSTPDEALGDETSFRLDASPAREAYLRFTVNGVPPFAVGQATLRLQVGPKSGNKSEFGGSVHSMTDNGWSEATTFNTRPVVDGPELDAAGSVATDEVVDFDVTAAVTADGTYSFGIVSNTSDGAGYVSREAGAGAPQLILTLVQNAPPAVTITGPSSGSAVLPDALLTLSATATDAEDGDLSGQVEWRSDLEGVLGTGASISATLEPGMHTITAEVSDSSGLTDTDQLMINVGSPPSVTISSPLDGTVVFTNEPDLTFVGSALDAEDGNLTAEILWTSSLDGLLGTGSTVTPSLSVGEHTITAAATDGDNLTGEEQISVRVRTPNVAPAVTITAPADGTTVPVGTTLALNATATDDFDGDLSGTIDWTSDLDGQLGSGSMVAVTLSEGTHTIMAAVQDSDGLAGAAQTTIVITPTPPAVTIVAPADGTVVFAGNPLTFTGTASDATDGDLSGVLVWTSDADGQIGAGASFAATLSEGTHTVTAAATNGSALTGQASISVVVRPPNALPVVTIDAPADGASLLGGVPVLLAGTATDTEDGVLSGQIAWSSSEDGALGTGATLTVPGLSEGAHTLTATVTDLDGASVSASVAVSVGESTLTFLAEADTYVDNSSPGDPLGAEDVFRLDASPVREAYVRFTVSGVPPFAVDQAILRLTVGPNSGNASDMGGHVHSMTDTGWSEATTTFNSRPVIDGAQLAAAGAVDTGDVVDFDVTAAVSADGTYSFGLLTDLSDAAGYRSREAGSGQPQLILHLKHNTAPVVNVTAPASEVTLLPDTPVTLTASATDAEDGALDGQIQWSSDLQGALGTGASITATLDPGTHLVTAEVTDSSGLTAHDEVTVNMSGAPDVTITAPSDGTVIFTDELPLTLSGTALDDEDGSLTAQLQWTSNNDGPIGTGGTVSATALSVGLHTITAAVTDSDSVTGQAQITVRVRLPNVGPNVTITAPSNGASTPAGTAMGLSATASDDFDGNISALVQWASDQDGALGTGATLAATLTEGAHVLTATVTDSDGVADTDQVSVDITPTPPTVTVTAPADGTTIFNTNPLTFTGAASDATDGDLSGALVWTSDLDGPIGTGATFTDTTLSVGTHTVVAAATDAGGLVGQAAVVVVVRPPNDLPVLTIDTPEDGAAVLTSASVLLVATALDTEDGDLGPQVSWTSDIAGALGTGGTISVPSLSPGTHVLTASVSDSDGATVTASVTVTVGQATLTFPAIADTYVDSSTAAQALGSETTFRIDTSPVREGYLRFDVTGVPPFAVDQALLRLTVGPNSGNASSVGGTVYSMSDETWSEATTTFNTKPTIDGPALATAGSVSTNDVVDFDVTAAILADGVYNFGLLSTVSDGAGYNTREASSGQPQLILTLKQNTAPVVTITAPASGTIVLPETPLVLSGTATDAEEGDLAAQIEWRSDIDGVLGSGATLSPSDLSDGPHTITAAVTDASEATTEATVDIVIEDIPVVVITAPTDGSSHFVTEAVTLTATANDLQEGDLSAQILWESSIDGPLGSGASVTTSSLSLGTHTIRAEASDSRSLTGEATISITVEVNDPPTVAITAPPAGTNYVEGTMATFTAAAIDPEQGDLSAAIAWTSSRDGALGTGPVLMTSSLSVGAHVITATIEDNRSLDDSATVNVTVEVNDPPVISITAPASGAIVHMSESVGFAGTATDPEDGDLTPSLTWVSDRDGPIGMGAGFATSTLSIGTHVITASATDTLSLASSAQITIEVINDAPSITVLSPTNGAITFIENPITFTATAVDTEDGDLAAGLSWTSSLDGALGAGGSFPLTTLSVGTHLITTEVTDSGGALGTASIILVVNEIPPGSHAPVVTIVQPAPLSAFEFGDPVTFTATATDQDDGDRGDFVTWTSDIDGVFGSGASIVISTLTIGTHQITATVSDSDGVVRFDQIQIEMEEPNEPPVVTISAPLDGDEVNEQDAVVFAATANDLEDGDLTAQLLWTSDVDGIVGTGGSFTTSTLSPGTHVLEATVIDSRGETGAVQIIITVHPIPAVTILVPQPDVGYLDATPVDFFADAVDAVEGDVSASLVWTSDLDGPIGTGRSFTTDTLTLGMHTITAVATNSRGGTGTAQVSLVVSVDTMILDPVADAYVDGAAPNTPFGLATDLLIDAGPAVREVYLRFDVNGIGPFPVDSADLILTVRTDGPGAYGGDLYTFTDNTWTESGVTFATRPTVDGPLVGTAPQAVDASDVVGFDLTSAIVGDGPYNLALRSLSEDGVRYNSREAAANHPQLTVVLGQATTPQIPELAITSPASGAVIFDDAPALLTATASDDEDGDLSSAITWTSDLDGPLGTGGSVSAVLSRGTHLITASVQDSFGLVAMQTVTLSIVDRPPPVSINAPAAGAFFPRTLPVTFSATVVDDLDGDLSGSIQWTSQRDGLLGTGASITTATLSSGDHVIEAAVTNSLGTTGTGSVTIYIDQAPPVITISSPPSGTTVVQGTPLTLMGTAMDLENGDLSSTLSWASDLEGVLGTGAAVPAVFNVVGTHHITASATDSHGFTTTAEITLTITVAPPVVTISAPVDGAAVAGPIGFSGTALDHPDGDLTASLQWTSDRDGPLGSGATVPPVMLSVGQHVITAQVIDSDGLTGTASITVVSGTVPPTVEITQPVSSNATVSEVIVSHEDMITFVATAADAFGADLDGSITWASDLDGPLGTGSSLSISTLVRGRHVITATVTDAGGLSATARIAVQVTAMASNTPPVVTITGPTSGTTVQIGTPITLSAVADDDLEGDLSASVSWLSDLDGLVGTGAAIDATFRTLGDHTITAAVADSIGLVGTAAVTVSVVAPSASFAVEADAHSDQSQSTTNFGALDELRLDQNPARTIYLRFTTTGIGAQGVGSAFVRMQTTSQSSAGSDDGGEIHLISNNTWDELTLTHANAPAVDMPALDSVGAVVPSQTVDFDVTPAVTGDGTFNFAINPMTVDLTIYRSRESSVGAPELVVFLEPPAPQEPVVEIIQPANFVTLPAGVSSTFSGIASDIQDGDLSVAIIWRSNVDGILGIGPSITRTLSAGPHVITAQVNDTSGFAGTDLIFVQVGDSPAVTILAPVSGTSIPLGESVLLAGSAFDPQDDDVTSSLAWASSIDGELGTGPSIMATLSPGTHVLTASVTDSDGHTGTAQTTVSVSIGNVGFRDHDFGAADTDNNRLTGAKPESKVWNTPDGIWWATLYHPTTDRYTIHRLDFPTQTWTDTGVEIDDRIESRQDVLFQDNKLYVVSRMSLPPGQNRFVRFTYHPAAQLFVRDPGFPVDIAGGGTESMTVARDSTGMLWAVFTNNDLVWIIHTIGGDDANWSDPFLVPIADENPDALGLYFDDIAAVQAIDGAIGVFWSNQHTKDDYFAVHQDGTPTDDPAFWDLEIAATGSSAADDHFNLKLASDGRLYVVVKTSRTAIGSTLNALLVRETDGTWSPMYHINSAENKTTRPVLLLDEVRRKLRVFYSPFENGIYTKESDMDSIAFPDPNGIGTPFISHSAESFLNNPTSTKSNIDPSTGFVVLAASKNEYWHNTIDPEPVPNVTISAPTDGEKVATGASVSFAGSAFSLADGDVTSELSWTSSLDGAIGAGSGFTTSTLSEGEHVVTASATDNDLLTGSASVTVTVESDAPPVVTIAEPMAGQKFLETDTVTFTGTALDSVDGDLTVGLQWTSTLDGPLGTGGSVTTTGLSLGTHTITAAVTDSGSLSGTAAVTVEIQVSAPPSLTISLPADGFSAAFGEAVPFAGTATDAFDGDLTSVISWVSDRDGAIGTGGSFSRPTLSLGTHTITATVTDSHGLSDSATVTVFIDPPVLVVTSPADGSTFVEGIPVTFAGTAVDPQDGDVTASITWSSSLDGMLGSGGSLAVDTLSPGVHTITAQVMDASGGTDTETLAITVLGHPVVTITDPADGFALDGGTVLTLNATALDPEDGDVAGLLVWSSDRDGQLGTGASVTTSALVTFGSHTITASVTDSDVLSGSDTITLLVNDPPTVTIQLPADGSTFDTTDLVDLNATASDGEDGDLSAQVVWSSDRDGALGSGASVTGLSLTAGVHTITASVTDGSGSTRTDTIVLTMNIPPTVTIATPADGATVQIGDPVNLTATANDSEDGDLSVAIIWSSDVDGPLGVGPSVTAASLTAGAHTITASVSDTAGSTRTDTITVTVNEAPGVAITAPADGVTIDETDSVTLSATATDPEDGDLSAQVAWTSDVDGVLGSGASVGSVNLSAGVHVITASVTDADAGAGSDTITVTVNALPIVTISAPVNGTTVETVDLVSLTGTATDAEDGSLTAQVAWSSDLDGPVGSGGSVTDVSLSAGVHTLTASVTDANGATGSDAVTLTVNTPPTVAIAAPADGATLETVNPLTLSATATDAEDGDLSAQVVWSSDQAGALGTGASVTGVFLSAGVHTITAAVTDASGSARMDTIVLTMNIPPTVTIGAPADGATFQAGDPVTLNATATDPEDGDLSAAIVWSSNVDGPLGGGASVTGVILTAGPHTITASVSDTAGSTQTDTITVTVNEAPMVAITAPADGVTIDETDSVTLSATATDPEDGDLSAQLAWTSDVDGGLGSGASVASVSLSAGVHVITASVTDADAGAGSDTITVTVNALPVVTISAPVNGATVETVDLVSLTGTATDAEDGSLTAQIAWSSDLAGALGVGGSVTGVSLAAGVHTLTASVTDANGAMGSDTVTLTVNTPPTVSIAAPAAGATLETATPLTLTATATDTEDGDLAAVVAWSSDQAGPLGTGGTVTGVFLSAGAHTITASVTDTDGSTRTDAITITMNTPPSVTITAPLDGAAFDTDDAVTLSGTASDAESGGLSGAIAWSSSLDGSLGTGGTVTGVSLSAGVHTITASVTDGGGSTRTDTAVVTVNAVPTLIIGAPTNGATFQASDLVNLSASANDAEDGSLTVTIAWSSDLDGSLGTGGTVTGVSLSAGVHTITASVTDSAGAGASASITLTINAPPVVTITAPADGATFASTDSIDLSGTANDPEDGDVAASIAWTSDLDGALGTGGSVTGASLSVGVHTITAAVTDSDAGAGSDQITLTITGP